MAAGMVDTKDLATRARTCASCHVGTARNVVDHELIAAGHPDLVFDLEAFSAAMPRHWPDAAPDDPWRSVRAWSTGQIVLLGESLDRLGRGAAAGAGGADFSELDCFGCHHSLTRPEDSWRQETPVAGRRPGQPPLNHARMAIARLVAAALDRAAGEQIDTEFTELAQIVAARPMRADQLQAKIAAMRPSIDALARKSATASFDAAAVRALISAIAADADGIAGRGERSAEQAAMALEVLTTAYSKNEKEVDGKAVRASLDRVLALLQNPSAFDPRRFAPALKQVAAQLPR
jgi:hypothetical protein